MFTNQKVSDRIYHLGVNDRRKHLFENLWPLPNGVAYNSYLIADDKTALLDTVESGSDRRFVERVADTLAGRDLDYLIINHMEPDHSGEIDAVVSRWPGVKIIGNAKTFGILKNYYDRTEGLMEVKDGDTLPLGHHCLKFVLTPWVHWPETMMTYDCTEKILFSADAFGSFGTLDGGVFDDEVDFDRYYMDDMRRYYSNIVGKYGGMVQKAYAKLADTEIKTICPLHGPIWRTDPGRVLALYDKWSRQEAEKAVVIVFASMYGNTEAMADYIARRVSEAGVKDIRVFDASKTHVSYLISEIWRAKGLILGSCAYNGYMHPAMEHLTTELAHYGIKDKVLGLFGSFSWNGGGVRNLKCFAEAASLPLVADPVEIAGRPDGAKLALCDAMAAAVAAETLK